MFLRSDIISKIIESAYTKIYNSWLNYALTLFGSESGLVCCDGYFRDQSTGKCISKW